MAQAQEVFLFQPTSITGCQLWLDGADVNGNGIQPVNGSTVSTWTDKSGLGNNATNVGSIIYSNNSLSWNATGVYFKGNMTITTNTLALFIVANVVSLGNGRWLFSASTNSSTNNFGNLQSFTMATTGSSIRAYRNNSSLSIATLPIGSSFIMADIFDGTNNTIVMNGTGATPVSNTGNFGIGFYEVGSSITEELAVAFNGSYQEVIVYNSAPTTAQRQQIEGYLAWKWGLQGNLPSNHPFKNYRPLANAPIPTQVPTMPLVTQTTQAFVPTQISGCQLWLDATDPLGNGIPPSNGAGLSIWKDKSTNGLSGTAVSSPTYQTNVQNGLPVIRFNGTNQYINFGNVLNLGTNGLTVFMVTKFAINA